MTISRRGVLISTCVGVTGMVGGIAQAAERSMDPDMDEIQGRLMKLDGRGTTLTTNQKFIVLLATVAAQGLEDESEKITGLALKSGLDPILIKEALYQVTPYVGFGRVQEALKGANEAFKKTGIKLPLATQKTVDDSNRLQKGIEVQIAIFGETITKMHKNTSKDLQSLMIDDLSGYCFGDFYTRTGMTIKDRELAVFAAIAALGGCESQLKAHTLANLKEGNSKRNLIDALQIALPLNGFPRTLNALAVVQGA